MEDTIMTHSTQEPVENQNLLDKQNTKSDNDSHHDLPQGNRDVCNGESNWREISVAALYRPDIGHFAPSIIGYFITSDDWNEQTLLALKEKAGADFLVGIQTDESECKYLFGHLDIIKGVIRCQPDDVEDVIKLLDVYSPRYDICLNAYDIKSLFECSHSFRFIQTIATGDCASALIKKTTQQLVSKLPSAANIKGIFVNPECSQSLSLDELSHISDAIESSYDGTELYYSQSFTDESMSFRLRAIYAES